MNENLINDLIEILWPLLDGGTSKGEIENHFVNVLDSWTPKKEIESE